MKCLSVASLMAIEAAVKNRLIRWGILAKDTTINESFRRYLIDQSLTFDSDNPALLMPHNFTKWRCREVLNADINDPCLGLGKVLRVLNPRFEILNRRFANAGWRTLRHKVRRRDLWACSPLDLGLLLQSSREKSANGTGEQGREKNQVADERRGQQN